MIRRMLWQVALACLALTTGTYASSQAETARTSSSALTKERLAAEVSAEVLNREFVTKIMLGNAVRHRAGAAFLVDTELQPDGRVRLAQHFLWLTEGGESRLTRDYHDSPDGVLYSIVKGTRVRVTELVTKDDRLELFLSSVPGGAYGKLKLMLGKDYEKKYDAESVLTLAASALKIERIETQLILASRFVELQRLIASTRAAMSASMTANDRLKQAEEMKTLLEEATRNRAEMESTTKRPAPEMESLKSDLADTELTLAASALEIERIETQRTLALQAAAAAERVTNARALLANAAAAGDELRKRATTPGKTIAEWEARRDAVTRWVPNAQKRQGLLKTLADLGFADPTQEAAAAEDLRAAQALMTSLDNEKIEVQLRDLRATYQGMVQKRTQLLDAYTRAYGTPKEREAARQLIEHLLRMHENRTAAAKLGDPAATAEVTRLQREIERLGRRY